MTSRSKPGPLATRTRRNERLMARFAELQRKEVDGIRLFRYQAILNILADEFFLTPDYVSRLVQRHNRQ